MYLPRVSWTKQAPRKQAKRQEEKRANQKLDVFTEGFWDEAGPKKASNKTRRQRYNEHERNETPKGTEEQLRIAGKKNNGKQGNRNETKPGRCELKRRRRKQRSE